MSNISVPPLAQLPTIYFSKGSEPSSPPLATFQTSDDQPVFAQFDDITPASADFLYYTITTGIWIFYKAKNFEHFGGIVVATADKPMSGLLSDLIGDGNQVKSLRGYKSEYFEGPAVAFFPGSNYCGDTVFTTGDYLSFSDKSQEYGGLGGFSDANSFILLSGYWRFYRTKGCPPSSDQKLYPLPSQSCPWLINDTSGVAWGISGVRVDENYIPEANWMTQLVVAGKTEGKYLSDLTIPGTHDSGSLHGIVTDSQYTESAVTQTMTIIEQLLAGIRFFDIRCDFVDGDLQIYHHWADEYVKLSDCLMYFADFIKESPSFPNKECVVLSLKNNNDVTDPKSSDAKKFYDAVTQIFSSYQSKFVDLTKNEIPSLQDALGKIVLIRQFILPAEIQGEYGIDASGSAWNHNSVSYDKSTKKVSGGFQIPLDPPERIWGQDDYKQVAGPVGINSKYSSVENLMLEAYTHEDSSSSRTLFINFTSAASGAYPYAFAKGTPGITGVNEKVASYVTNLEGEKRLGIIVMDFPEYPSNSMIQDLIQTNFK